MFNESLLSIALVVLVEAITAVIQYLRNKLVDHLHRHERSYYDEPGMA